METVGAPVSRPDLRGGWSTRLFVSRPGPAGCSYAKYCAPPAGAANGVTNFFSIETRETPCARETLYGGHMVIYPKSMLLELQSF